MITYNYSHKNNTKAREKLLENQRDLYLNDIFRILNKKDRTYTWCTKNPIRMARFDYFLVTPDFLDNITSCSIENGYRSDHSLVTIETVESKNKRGHGYWKFNLNFLHDKDFVKKIKDIITETKEQYINVRN
jgi:hypothetical protein